MYDTSKTASESPALQKPSQVHKMVESMSEESATGYTHHFPEDLPPRDGPPPASRGWRGRLRSRFWTFSLSSYSLIHTPDGQARLRRIVMITILVLRMAMSALSILSAIIKKNVAGIIVYSLLAVLSFWFTATCLAIIGDAAGDRRVTGMIIVSFQGRLETKVHILISWPETLALRCILRLLFAHTRPIDCAILFRTRWSWFGAYRHRYVASDIGRRMDRWMGA